MINVKEVWAKPDEKLAIHLDKTLRITKRLLKEYRVITERFATLLDDNFFTTDNKVEELNQFVLELVEFHDHGKVNPFFQDYMENEGKYVNKENRQHSIYSFFIWFIHNSKKDLPFETLLLRTMVGYGVITGHHGRLKSFFKYISNSDIHRKSNAIKDIYQKHLIKWEKLNVSRSDFSNSYRLLGRIEKKIRTLPKCEYLLTLSKFGFSILVNSDSISSSSVKVKDYNVLLDDIFFRDIRKTNFNLKYNSNKIIQGVNNSEIDHNDHFSNITSMNGLRTLVNKKIQHSIDGDVDVYIIESPVGTGKTLSSLRLSDEIIKSENKRKIINVFPLNSVQTQYIKTLTEDLELDESIINVVNSESVFGMDKKMNEDNIPITDSNLWLLRRNCFSEEIIVTSHVNFFEVFTSVTRKGSLGLLSLIDSIVIIDELQNYPRKYWYQIWDELLTFSEVFGTKFIVTTGTLPISNTLLEKVDPIRIKKVFNSRDYKELFSSPFVKDRCKVEYLDEGTTFKDVDNLKEKILEDIEKQEQEGKTQFIVCMTQVNTTKKLYKKIKKEKKNYQVYYLCGRHSSSYKKEMLEQIKKHNENPDDKVILVTTKTVECGMDFDFDYGYKEFDRYDSVEQLSGRVNRSNKKQGSGVKVFKWNRRKMDDEKLFILKKHTLTLINEKRFDQLSEEITEDNKIDIETVRSELSKIHQDCDFETYEKIMTIIENQDYITEIYLVLNVDEGEFRKNVDTFDFTNKDYSEKVQLSTKQRESLEPYRIKVTNKWLNKVLNKDMIEREYNGVKYYLPTDDEFFLKNKLEKYQVNNVVSYLEKLEDIDSTYEYI